jgi:hypothetical protein
MGFTEVGLKDFAGTPHFEDRSRASHGYFSASCDFNHDGVADEARLLRNDVRGVLYAVAVIQGSGKVDTYVLKAARLSDLPDIAIEPISTRGSACNAVRVFRFGAKGEVLVFDGEEFRPVDAQTPVARDPASYLDG